MRSPQALFPDLEYWEVLGKAIRWRTDKENPSPGSQVCVEVSGSVGKSPGTQPRCAAQWKMRGVCRAELGRRG